MDCVNFYLHYKQISNCSKIKIITPTKISVNLLFFLVVSVVYISNPVSQSAEHNELVTSFFSLLPPNIFCLFF